MIKSIDMKFVNDGDVILTCGNDLFSGIAVPVETGRLLNEPHTVATHAASVVSLYDADGIRYPRIIEMAPAVLNDDQIGDLKLHDPNEYFQGRNEIICVQRDQRMDEDLRSLWGRQVLQEQRLGLTKYDYKELLKCGIPCLPDDLKKWVCSSWVRQSLQAVGLDPLPGKPESYCTPYDLQNSDLLKTVFPGGGNFE